MSIPDLSRRAFLSGGVKAAGVLALLPGMSLGCAAEDVARAPSDLRVLTASEWTVLDAVGDAFVPAGGAFEAGARSVDLATRIDAFVAEESPALLAGLATALLLVERVSPLLTGSLAPFSRLDEAGRTACLEALCASRIGALRDAFAGMKTLCLFAFYSADASWPALGYDGPLVGRTV